MGELDHAIDSSRDGRSRALAELRRRIQGSFSASEVRSLGAALGLDPTLDWERGTDALVRDVVRRAVEVHGVAGLVEQLQRDKPLVEWADLAPPPPPAPAVLVPDLVSAQPPVAPPVLELSPPAPTVEAAPLTVSPTEIDPPPPGSAASWPMQNLNANVQQRPGIDPKIFAITAGCIAVAVAIAFAAGMVWRGSPSPQSSGPAGRSDGLAGHAADAVDAALIDVARGCGLEVPKAPGREVLRRVQTSCGHPVAAAGRPAPGFDAQEIEPPKLALPPRDPPRVNPGTRDPAPPKADPCRVGCTAEHNACKSGCKSEPTDASEYEAWQGCMTKCLGAESKCRQRCQ